MATLYTDIGMQKETVYKELAGSSNLLKRIKQQQWFQHY